MIRTAQPSDAPQVAALETALFGSDQWSAEAGLVADVDGAVVGYAAVVMAGDVADLARIAVAQHCRRRGIASAVLAEACAVARADGAARMMLEVAESNADARAFYAAHGFTEIFRRGNYYADGDDALVLTLALR